jgi:hypothetical protein
MLTVRKTFVLAGVVVLAAAGITAGTAVGASGNASGKPLTTAEKIASAMSAAPRSLARNATIKDYPSSPQGSLVLLRSGSNGWTCLPDDPSTPGPDPMCFDKQTGKWVDAWMAHKAPHLTSPGFAYMLQGSSDASNTDPFATKPAKGQHWMTSPPHVMFFPAGELAKGSYSTDPANGGPWVMFPDTPYAHVMMPVGSTGDGPGPGE